MSKEDDIKLIINYPPEKNGRDRNIISAIPEPVVGPRGPQGPPGQGFDVSTLSVVSNPEVGCRRRFIFDGMLPKMFSNYDGYTLNNQYYPLDGVKLDELNEILLANHGIKVETDGVIYTTHLPNQVESLALRPTGFNNPTSFPAHHLVSYVTDASYHFLVKGSEEVELMDCSEVTSLVRDVVQRELAIAKASNTTVASGVIKLDDMGVATVVLPVGRSWSHKYSYNLTPMYTAMNRLHILTEVGFNTGTGRWSFSFGGGVPDGQVSWHIIATTLQ